MTITSRERVLKALAHEQPDVTPWQIDLTIDAHNKTAQYLDDPGFMAKVGNHLAGYEDGHFGEVRPDYWQDQFGIVWNRTIDKDIGNVDEMLIKEPDASTYDFPEPDLERNARGMERLVAEHANEFRLGSVGFSMFERAWTLRGMENLLVDMILHPRFVDDLLDKILEYNLKVIDHMVTYDLVLLHETDLDFVLKAD